MTCLFCRRDLRPCQEGQRPHRCGGWVHEHNASHTCHTEHLAQPDSAIAPVHQITASLGLACGHEGTDPGSTDPADVTCFMCKRAAREQVVA